METADKQDDEASTATNKDDDDRHESVKKQNQDSSDRANYYFIVLVAIGRTGSSVTWRILSKLLTGTSTQCLEWTGYNHQSSYHFFRHDAREYSSSSSSSGGTGTTDSERGNGLCWIDHFFCKLISKQVVATDTVISLQEEEEKGDGSSAVQNQMSSSTLRSKTEGTRIDDFHEAKNKTYLLGFQWKAFGDIMEQLDTPKQGLQRLSELFSTAQSSSTTTTGTATTANSSVDNDHPHHPSFVNMIQGGGVIRLRRNLLDVYLSRTKHEHVRNNNHYNDLPSHCHKDDQVCLNKHVKATTTTSTTANSTSTNNNTSGGIHVNVDDLLKFLNEWTSSEDQVDEYLNTYDVPTVHVSYDKLYYPATTTTTTTTTNDDGTTTALNSTIIDSSSTASGISSEERQPHDKNEQDHKYYFGFRASNSQAIDTF